MPSPAAIRLLNKLERVKNKAGGGWTARCPVAGHRHGDSSASLSVDEREGKLLLKCFTFRDHDAEAIAAAVGLSLTDLFSDSALTMKVPIPFKSRSRGELVACYQYRDMTGNFVAEKGRFELPDGKKSFLWRPFGSTDGWPGLEALGLSLSDLALWGAETVAEAPDDATIYFVEGEKTAQACREAGLIAVTHAGGASTKDFGKGLDILTGRKIALWPDNDGPGREYMALVEVRLRGLASAISTVTVPVPPKGDAYDYFASGGTVVDLEQGIIPLRGAVVDYLPDDAVRVTIPSPVGRVVFTFEDIERAARSFDCQLTVQIDAPGYSKDPYSERVNTLSHTAREALRRELDSVYGKELGWTKLLNTALGTGREAYLSLDRSQDVFEIPDSVGDLFFLKPLLPDRAPTVWFGDGSSLKSYTAYTLGACVALGIDFLADADGKGGFAGPQGAVLIVDYEDNAENIRRRMKRIFQGLGCDDVPEGLIRYFPANGIPLKDLVPALIQVVRQYGIILIIIDSVGPACGGEPEKSVVALDYFRALARLKTTTLSIAHITKEAGKKGNTDYPFGSIFWHNTARRTWFIARDQEEESDDLDIGFYNRKVNDGPKPRPFGVKVHFDGFGGPVRLTYQDIADVPALQAKRPPRQQIIDVLKHGPMASGEIASETGLSEDTVQRHLKDSSTFKEVGTRGGRGRPATLWGLVTTQYVDL